MIEVIAFIAAMCFTAACVFIITKRIVVSNQEENLDENLDEINTHIKDTAAYCSNSITEMNKKIDKLENIVIDLYRKDKPLSAVKNDYPVCVDFNKMNAVSIERMYDPETYEISTVIGYMKPNGEIGEWFLNITDEQHEDLTYQFEEIIKLRDIDLNKSSLDNQKS
jgi:hypothetical protein